MFYKVLHGPAKFQSSKESIHYMRVNTVYHTPCVNLLVFLFVIVKWHPVNENIGNGRIEVTCLDHLYK
jgi:hypothetical protein